jgi:tRNA-binding protein
MLAIEYNDFAKIDIRVGEIVRAYANAKAKKKAYVLEIDFGEELGIKISSAQITVNYSPELLLGTKVCAIVNFPAKNIAGILSEVLVLGAVGDKEDIVLLHPGLWVPNGSKVL